MTEIPFIPAPHEEERLRSGYNVVQEYRKRYEDEHAGEPWIEDRSGFVSRPDWRKNPDFLSVQNIRSTKDGTAESPSYFWTVVGWLFATASVVPFIMRLF